MNIPSNMSAFTETECRGRKRSSPLGADAPRPKGGCLLMIDGGEDQAGECNSAAKTRSYMRAVTP